MFSAIFFIVFEDRFPVLRNWKRIRILSIAIKLCKTRVFSFFCKSITPIILCHASGSTVRARNLMLLKYILLNEIEVCSTSG